MVDGAGFARVNEQLEDRVLACASEARDRTNAHTFAEKVKDVGALCEGQLVHAVSM